MVHMFAHHVGLVLCVAFVTIEAHADDKVAPLPAGVKAVWDLDKAHREATETRERVSLNGLWRWRPAEPGEQTVPDQGWGHFKVPGCWPGITDYLQKDCQTVFRHPLWESTRLAELRAAWYERELTVPSTWEGRRVLLGLNTLSSLATVFVDGKAVGEVGFPGGELDLSSVCRPGARHRLTMLVVALPLKGVMLSYSDSASAKQVKGTVARRGLCGDVFLIGRPMDARVGDVRVNTSVREGSITIDAECVGLGQKSRYALQATIREDGRVVKTIKGPLFAAADLVEGRAQLRADWRPNRLWDIHTPGNQHTLSLSLVDENAVPLDTAFDERFGFREFWIEGKDFHLNGSRVFLCAVPLDNAQVSAGLATYDAARESLERLKGFGINFVYTHNYGCEPGTHLAFAEVLRAADDVGILVSFSQPHFGQYDWKAPEADSSNGYARHAASYVREAGNHPSIVFYSMSHNATGYSDDMNPDMIDGRSGPRDNWSRNNASLALRAEAIVRKLDPGRVVYHHSSGNLGSMHTSNFYPNFAPIQELSDWFEHWATAGIKPMFTCEYGAPFTWDWSMYRGWYRGERSFGSAQVPWEFAHAEWNAQFLGDRAYQIKEMEKANLRYEARQFRQGSLWHRWDYPKELSHRDFDDRQTVIAMYLADNWRAFRTWGVSAISPWEYGHYWKPREGVDRRRKDLPVDWEHLQRPGLSPDFLDGRYERMDLAFERADWVPAPPAQTLLRDNRPLLAWLAGKPERFTSKDHVFSAGESFQKQIIVLNNSRETVTCDCAWSLDLPAPINGRERVTVLTGEQKRIPLKIKLPTPLPAGRYRLALNARFHTGEVQEDTFAIDVLPSATATSKATVKIALFDPKGETASGLKALGIPFDLVEAMTDLSRHDLLIVGKEALSLDGPAPDLTRVREGLKALVFEQTSAVLERRLGLRVVEYGLRQVFPRLPDHPVLTGLPSEHLRDWRGEATIMPPRLAYEMRPMHGPTVQWSGIPVTRAWRCGNRGNVASVLIEKPTRGDFLPIVDGGFSLQYAPLLQYREGRGMVVFCQLDVTGRTETEPVAERLTRGLVEYVATWRPTERREAAYAGEAAGLVHLQKAGLDVKAADVSALGPHHVLIVGPGGGSGLASQAPAIANWLKAGGRLVVVGLDEREANSFLPLPIKTRDQEHIATFFDPPGMKSSFAGIAPADMHNRDPRPFPLLTEGARLIGDGSLAEAPDARIAFIQVVPWRFQEPGPMNQRRTHRRASFALSRVLANVGVISKTDLLDHLTRPVDQEKRRLSAPYLDVPEEWDDPYRFFRW